MIYPANPIVGKLMNRMERYAKIVIWESLESEESGAENVYLCANLENLIKWNLKDSTKATEVTMATEHLLSCFYHTAYFLSDLVTLQYKINPAMLNST